MTENKNNDTLKVNRLLAKKYGISRIVERIWGTYNIFRENKIKDIYREFIWMRNAKCKADGSIGQNVGITLISPR